MERGRRKFLFVIIRCHGLLTIFRAEIFIHLVKSPRKRVSIKAFSINLLSFKTLRFSYCMVNTKIKIKIELSVFSYRYKISAVLYHFRWLFKKM